MRTRHERRLAGRPGPAGTGRCPAAVAAVALAVWVGGCTEPLSPEARQLLVDSKAAYDGGDDAAVLQKTSAFLAEHANAGEADVAFYFRGLSKYRLRDSSGAMSDLKEAFTRTNRREIQLGSAKALGDLAFESGDAVWAEDMYYQALQYADPARKPTDEIRYRLGCVLQRKGDWSEADRQFDLVLHLFAGSPSAQRAERRARCLAWTVQTGVYARRDAALAEAKRLGAAKLPAAAKPLTYGGTLRFHVQIGTYKTWSEAGAALPGIRRLRKDAILVPTR